MAGIKRTGKLTRKIDNQEFDVEWKNDSIFHIGTKSQAIKNLKTFVLKECGKCWQFEDRRVATLKREYLRELLDVLG